MPNASNVKYDSSFVVRIPNRLLRLLDRTAERRNTSRSELIRQAVERIVASETGLFVSKRAWIRHSIVRRCMICRSFVRSGYTCRTCRTTRWDSIVVAGNVVPVPSMPPIPFSSRPDMRDSRWQTAEQVVIDAFSPLVGVIYELLTREDCLEPTNLDEVRDLLVLAASLNK